MCELKLPFPPLCLYSPNPLNKIKYPLQHNLLVKGKAIKYSVFVKNARLGNLRQTFKIKKKPTFPLNFVAYYSRETRKK